ncbi:MAG: UvrD-helicase domain-containing protein [Proteobacteria bacterium]|nr:UvrD-helicase domain-containing protein [Pseudomonadota bacterium]
MSEFVPTEEQRSIISYPPKPLRVVAGAGTGKTTTIVQRLARAAAAGGDPTRALGITFTNKAADELRTRLRETLGDREDGREVEVSTYHGFASSILDEFGAFAGYSPTAGLMDEGHRSELAYRILHELESTDLDLSSLTQRRDDLLSIADSLTSNLLDGNDVEQLVPPDPDDVWAKRAALLHAARRYDDAKRRLDFLEYADLIKQAVAIVENFPNIADQIAERYDSVLLDEYQDTDPAQRRLLTAVFTGGAAVTAVGDADQTIYLENFDRFPAHFPTAAGTPAETLPLSINRRSDRVILDMANAIQQLLPRIDESKPLAPHEDAQRGSLVTAWFRTDEDESSWIAEQITSRHEDGIAWSDIAILCRKRSAIPSIIVQLRDADIPFSVSSMGELLTIPEVADLLAWLRVLSDPSNEPSLLRLWMGGRFRIGLHTISLLRTWCGKNPARNLAIALEHLDDINSIEPEEHNRLEEFLSLYRDLHSSSQVMSVPAILAMTIERLGFWDEVAALRPGHAVTARINIGRFSSLANHWRPLDGIPTLEAFLRYVDALDDAQPAEELEAAGDVSGDVVQVITAHAAKGLEWPVVFLPSLAEGTFPSGVRLYDDPDRTALALPYSVRLDRESFTDAETVGPGKVRTAILKTRHVDAEWRLAYVAVTRAKNELLMSGHAWDRDVTRPRSPSSLLTIATDIPDSTIATWRDDPGNKPEQPAHLEPVVAPDPLFPSGWAAALRNRIADERWIPHEYPDMVHEVENRSEQLSMQIANLPSASAHVSDPPFATSVTNLVSLAECPLKFKWIHHDRLPRKPRDSARRGTEFHRRVELHNLGVLALDDPGVETYDSVLIDAPANEGAHVKGDPWNAFNESRFVDEHPRFVEVPLALNEGTVRGKIDAIYETTSGVWEIVDYKSGTRKDDVARNVQLEAYAIAVDEGVVSRDVPDEMSVTFAYFGSGSCEESTTRIDDDWLSEARSHVTQLLIDGREGPFDPRPSSACRYCDFLHHCAAGQTTTTNS